MVKRSITLFLVALALWGCMKIDGTDNLNEGIAGMEIRFSSQLVTKSVELDAQEPSDIVYRQYALSPKTGKDTLYVAVWEQDFDEGIITKATPVTSLSSFKASATKGASGQEVQAWNNVTFTGPTNFTGGKYWPTRTLYNDEGGYHFYASNASLNFAAAGCTVDASTETDVVCAYVQNPTYGRQNALAFDHVFAQLGTVTVSSEGELSGVSIKLTPRVGGTYNLRTHEWSDVVEGSETVISTAVAGTKTNDILLLPGVYILNASWTADGDNYSNWRGSIAIEAGKRSNLSISLEGGIPAIVSITSSAATIWKGGTTTYSATCNKGDVTWSSSNTSVATVNPSTGVITAVASGEADIIATYGSTSNSKKVYVNELTGLSFSDGSSTISSVTVTHYHPQNLYTNAILNNGGSTYGTPGSITVGFSSNNSRASWANSSMTAGSANQLSCNSAGDATLTISVPAGSYGNGSVVSATCAFTGREPEITYDFYFYYEGESYDGENYLEAEYIDSGYSYIEQCLSDHRIYYLDIYVFLRTFHDGVSYSYEQISADNCEYTVNYGSINSVSYPGYPSPTHFRFERTALYREHFDCEISYQSFSKTIRICFGDVDLDLDDRNYNDTGSIGDGTYGSGSWAKPYGYAGYWYTFLNFTCPYGSHNCYLDEDYIDWTVNGESSGDDWTWGGRMGVSPDSIYMFSTGTYVIRAEIYGESDELIAYCN